MSKVDENDSIMALGTPSLNINLKITNKDYHKDEQKSILSNSSKEEGSKPKTECKRSSNIPEPRLRRLIYPESKKQGIFTMISGGPVLIASVPTMIPVIPQFYAPFPQPYVYPATVNTWNTVLPVHSIYTMPVPLHMVTPPYTASSLYSNITSEFLFSPVTTVIDDTSELFTSNEAENPVEYCNSKTKDKIVSCNEETDNKFNTAFEESIKTKEPIETYLDLPKQLFPSAKTLPVDPNSLIDEFCKMCNIEDHALWILDLEFGVPKYPTRRLIPMYNVKYNSVNCKNAPEAIHPGFEGCCQDFKRAFLFYYDGIISNWYRGYTIMYNDKSVEKFQEWIRVPMEALGMCWV